jgi:hypothetical protein
MDKTVEIVYLLFQQRIYTQKVFQCLLERIFVWGTTLNCELIRYLSPTNLYF